MEYFAALPTEEIGTHLSERIQRFYSHLQASEEASKMKRAFRARFGLSTNGSPARSDSIAHGGEDGAYSFLKVNHLGNLSTHLLNLVTAQRPSPKPIATNTDSRSINQTVLANGLLDFYSVQKGGERHIRNAADLSIATSEGWVGTSWDAAAGKPYAVDDEGQPIHEGDIRYDTFTAFDVVRDVESYYSHRQDWLATRTFLNRFELAARYPDMEEQILTMPASAMTDLRLRAKGRFSATSTESDEIAVFDFYHEKCRAVPAGRYVRLLSDGTVLFDGPLPYDRIQVRRIAPLDIPGSIFGHTPVFDLLALQEAVDALYSIVLTNQSTFGVQNIWVPNDSDVTFETLARGLNLIRSGPQSKPEALNLTATPREIFEFIAKLEEAMETLSGVNSVVRGNPEASLKSGSALALVQSQAIQFSIGLQISLRNLVGDVFTDTINTLKRFARTERVALLAGRYNQYLLKSFVGEDLADIERVIVEDGGALEKTASGRIQMVEHLIQLGAIKTPEEYFSVINTGRHEPATEATTRELANLRRENELLAQGTPVRTIATDNHKLHILEHATVLQDPDVRAPLPENQAIQQATTQHILEHLDFLKTMDPALLMLLGQESLMPMMGMMPPGAPPDAGAGPMPEAPAGENPTGAPPQPDMPSYPKMPSGEQWSPESGGGVAEQKGNMPTPAQ